MAILILMLLLVVWVVVLAPGVWRRRAERRASDSISSFHQQLGVLQRAGRTLVPPAQRLRGAGTPVAVRHRGGAEVRRPTLVLLRPEGNVGAGGVHRSSGFAQPATMGPQGGLVGGRLAGGAPGLRSAQGLRHRGRYFHPAACKRRRDILVGLVASVVGAAVLGAIPPLHPLLTVALVGVMLLVGYLFLLVRLRGMAIQRQNAVRVLSDQNQQDWFARQTPADDYEMDEPTAQVAIR